MAVLQPGQFLRPQLSVPWVLGGSGFSLCPEHLLELTGAEYGIIGAGEAAIVELASELDQGKKITRQIWTKSVRRGRYIAPRRTGWQKKKGSGCPEPMNSR